MKRRDLQALQSEAESIIRSERRALIGVDLFDRLPKYLQDKTTRAKIYRDLAKTTMDRAPNHNWTIDPKSLWVTSQSVNASSRGERIRLLREAADRAFCIVEEHGPRQMRDLQEAVSPDLDFLSFKKALVNRICATSRFGRTGETVFLRAPIKSG